jgi:hypothetical protein
MRKPSDRIRERKSGIAYTATITDLRDAVSGQYVELLEFKPEAVGRLLQVYRQKPLEEGGGTEPVFSLSVHDMLSWFAEIRPELLEAAIDEARRAEFGRLPPDAEIPQDFPLQEEIAKHWNYWDFAEFFAFLSYRAIYPLMPVRRQVWGLLQNLFPGEAESRRFRAALNAFVYLRQYVQNRGGDKGRP